MPKKGQRKSREVSTPNSDLDGEPANEPRRLLTTEELLDEISPVTQNRKTSKRRYASSASSSDESGEIESEEKEDEESTFTNESSGLQFEGGGSSSKKLGSKLQKTVTPAKQMRPKKKTPKTPQSRSPADTRHTTPSLLSSSEGSTPLTHHQPSIQKDGSPPSTNEFESSDRSIAATLKEISNTLSKVVSKIDRQESRLDSMEKKIANCSSISSSSSESGSKKIPPIIRVCIY